MKLSKKRQIGLEVALEVVSDLQTCNPELDDKLMFATMVLRNMLKGNDVFFSDEEKKEIIKKEVSRLFNKKGAEQRRDGNADIHM